MSEAYSKPCRISKTELFAKIVNGFQQLIIFAKCFILDIQIGSEYTSEKNSTEVFLHELFHKKRFKCFNFHQPASIALYFVVYCWYYLFLLEIPNRNPKKQLTFKSL